MRLVEEADDRTPSETARGLAYFALSALSLCRSRTAGAIATALTKTREELERPGEAAIWFEVVNSHKQNGGNDADAEDVNESQHLVPSLLR